VSQTNVFGEPIDECCSHPMTGYFRDGFCRTSKYDQGSHTVCALITDAFLVFSQSRGNDLSTPRPEFEFPGLVEGQSWCLCAARWLEAHEAGCAPKVHLKRTNIETLKIVPMDILRGYATDLN
jgi:uncharacterized protein (DUF2237 family)